MIKLSAAIITFNESANIARCINALKPVADDIVVVDSFSTDDTCQQAEALGARVVKHAFEGHIQQKNFAVTQCLYPHVLSVDADEVLDSTLQQSIIAAKADWQYDGYYVDRMTSYCGRWIKHGGWYPDRKLRLWDSTKGRWGGRNPHDKYEMQASARLSMLKGTLLHYSYNTISEHLLQVDKFTTITAQQLYDEGVTVSFIDLYFKPAFHFFNAYFIKGGFRDGWQGYTIARISAAARLIRYSKLKFMYQQRNNAGNISH